MIKNKPLKIIVPFLCIIIAGFIVYGQALFFNFVYLDDQVLILQNQDFLSQSSGILQAFKGDIFNKASGGSYYRPLLTLSFMLDARIAGNAPFFYHLTNIILHVIVSSLLFLLLKRLNYRAGLSFLFALIFTIHPVLAQTVAWIPGRNDSLLSIFILSAFLALINLSQTKKYKWYFLHLLFFAGALFTKEIAVIYPLICLFYLSIIAKEKILTRNSILLFAGWCLVIIPWFLIRWGALKQPIGNPDYKFASSLLLNLPAIVPYYIGKVVAPLNLSVFPLFESINPSYGIIVIFFITLSLILSKKRRLNFIIFGLLWFLLFLVPSFLQTIFSSLPVFTEHRVYLSSIGVIFLFLEFDFIKNINLKKNWALIIFVPLLFSIMSIAYVRNFKDGLSFWRSATLTSPNSAFSHNNLGSMHYLNGALDKAESEWLKALELNPNEKLVHNNLGLIYMNSGLYEKAEDEFKKEIEINPLYNDAYLNLKALYYKQGKIK